MISILFWLKFSLKTASCVSTLKRNTRHWCCIEEKSKSWARTLTWKCQEKVFPLILFTTFFTMYKKEVQVKSQFFPCIILVFKFFVKAICTWVSDMNHFFGRTFLYFCVRHVFISYFCALVSLWQKKSLRYNDIETAEGFKKAKLDSWRGTMTLVWLFAYWNRLRVFWIMHKTSDQATRTFTYVKALSFFRNFCKKS